jgi:SET domain-containing protein
VSHSDHSYLSPKLEAQGVPDEEYVSVVAREPIEADELLILWGGRIVTKQDFDELPDESRRRSLQVDEELFLVPTHLEQSDFVNHSCDPNAWIEGHSALRARRRIAAGEEITFDYAMTDGCDYDEFECLCGSTLCRGKVTGTDWQLPELQERYGEHFSPYLLRRMQASL